MPESIGRATAYFTKCLNFNVDPITLFEASTCTEVAGYLVCQDAHPDTDDSPVEDITTYIGEDGTNNGNAEH